MLNLRKHNILRGNSFIGNLLRIPFLIIPDNTVVFILTGILKGKKWIIGSHNKSVWLGIYERKQTITFAEKCKGKNILWDLGAHSGYYTLLFKTVNKESTVYSFEPVDSNSRYFQKHMDLNNLGKIIHSNNAVSDKEGVLKFAKGNSVGGKLCEEGDMEVSVVKLSALLERREIEIPDVIKMDIEGAEFEVLKDLKSLLSSNQKPLIFLSTHSREDHDSCIDLMKLLKYNIIPLDAGDVFNAREFLLEPVKSNYA